MNNYQHKRTKLGWLMYKLTYNWSEFLKKHVWLWYVLNLTWGLPMTLFGALISLGLLISGHKPRKFMNVIEFDFGNNWGGLEGGIFIFVANNMGDEWTLHTRCHEYGHSFQNALFGPFTIFLISIPSVIRYWVRKFQSKKGKQLPSYDEIWFEGSATDIGLNIYYNIYYDMQII